MDQSRASVPSTVREAWGAQGRTNSLGHGQGCGVELLTDRLGGAAALAHVAVDAAGEADVVGGVDVDREVIEGQELRVVEGEDTLNDDDASAGVMVSNWPADAGVGFEIVDGALDGEASGRGCGRARG